MPILSVTQVFPLTHARVMLTTEFTLHISSPSLKFAIVIRLNTHDDFYSADPGSMQGDGHIWTQLNDLALHEFSHWIERPPGVRKVMGSISVGDSDFFFVPRSSHVDQFAFHFSTTLSFRFCKIDY